MMPDVIRFFHPVLEARALNPGPVQIELAERKYALFRDASGRPAALRDACPHRLAPLSMGKVRPDGRLACSYHGWHFDAEGHGQAPSQPSLKCETASFQVVERYNYLWIAALETPLSTFPEMGWDDFEFAGAFSTLFKCPLHVALDNFSEDEHLPYVHGVFGWNENTCTEIEYEAKSFEEHTEVHYRGSQRPHPILPFLGVKKGDRFHNDWETHFDPLRATFTFHWFDPNSKEERPFVLRAVIFMMPETKHTTRFHTFLFFKTCGAFLNAIKPIVRRATLTIARQEIEADAAFVHRVANTPEDLKGLRLGRFDTAVTKNRKLLKKVYQPEKPLRLVSQEALGDSQ